MGGMANRSYEQVIAEHIQEFPGLRRPQIIHAFPTLSPKTVYLNIKRLKEKHLVDENNFGQLYPSAKMEAGARDSWPLHKVLQEYRNFNEMTNAFAWQDDKFKEWCMTVAAKYGTEITVMLVQCTIIMTNIKNLDVHKNYEEKKDIDRVLLKAEQDQLESILDKFVSIFERTNKAS